jgi:hypothetical protein
MKEVGQGRGLGRAWQGALAFAVLACAAGGSAAGEMFQCGKVFQDRPCEQTDVQQRFSRTQGTFAIEQVNPTTDQDCARVAADAMAWWRRMAAGEPMEKLQAEIQDQKISRYAKSVLRDVLIAVKNSTGSQREVRGEFETHCMAYKRRNGYATERDLASPAASGGAVLGTDAARQSPRQAEVDARRAEIEARQAQAEARRAEAVRARALRSQPQF